jgi:hypothetical protein
MSEIFKVNGRKVSDVQGAIGFIKEFLVHTLSGELETGYGKSYDFDLYLPYVMDWVLNVPQTEQEGFSPTHELEILYMEAGWEMVLEGLLRPGPRSTNGEVPGGSYGKGYSLTNKGWKWLKTVDKTQTETTPAQQADGVDAVHA